MSGRVVEKERFAAVDDTGRRYTVVRYMHLTLVQSMGAEDQWIETIGEYRTDDGRHLNVVPGTTDQFEFLPDFFDNSVTRIRRVKG